MTTMSLKPILQKYFILQNLFNSCRLQHAKLKQRKIVVASLLGYATTVGDMLFLGEKTVEETPQLEQVVQPSILEVADKLFAVQKYKESYDILDQARYTSDPEVLWRLSRLLFVMADDDKLARKDKDDMITKAYDLIKEALQSGDNCSEVHKWMAILLNAKCGQGGIYEKAKVIPEIRKYLMQSLQLNPSDISVLYMLGYICYQLASLTWFQRQLATIFYVSPPISSFQEAYNYFIQAEIRKPRFFISNVYMLGKSCYDMGNYYRAKYYLDIAASLPCRTQADRITREKAKQLSAVLKTYELSHNILLGRQSHN